MGQAFAILVQEERQREIKTSNHAFIESTSLNVSTSGSRSFKTDYTPSTSYPGNISYSGNNKSKLYCDFCKRPGLTRDNCYKIHGYPNQTNQRTNPNTSNQNNYSNRSQGYQGYNQNTNSYNQSNYNQNNRFNKGKEIVANAHRVDTYVKSTKEGETSGQNDNQGVTLTRRQYEQLINLIQHFQNDDGVKHLNNSLTSGAVNFAGPFTEERLVVCMMGCIFSTQIV